MTDTEKTRMICFRKCRLPVENYTLGIVGYNMRIGKI